MGTSSFDEGMPKETLNEALQNVKHEAFQMKKDFDEGNVDSG